MCASIKRISPISEDFNSFIALGDEPSPQSAMAEKTKISEDFNYFIALGDEASPQSAMAEKASLSSSFVPGNGGDDGGDELSLYGSESGWVEARTHCAHLNSISSESDAAHIPAPDTPCHSCQHPAENWVCLTCKDVLCSRFVNKHMLQHYHQKNHPLALSYSDLSVWCFACDAYLDAQVILPLRPFYESAYILKFCEAPPMRTIADDPAQGSGSSGQL